MIKPTRALSFAALALALSGCASSSDSGPQNAGGGAVSTGGSVGVSGSAGAAPSSGGSSGNPAAGAPSAGAPDTAGADTAGGNSAGGSSAAGASQSVAGAPSGSTGPFPFNPSYIIGADISWTLEDEAGGAKYADRTGVKPIEQILVNNGFNFVRLRTFVCPSCAGGYNRQGFCDDKHTVTMAKRVKACGMGLLLGLSHV